MLEANYQDTALRAIVLVGSALLFSIGAQGQRPISAGAKAQQQVFDPALVQAGKNRFSQNCAFCHGRDAMGGESGPNLTHSSVVTSDVNGDKIGVVVRNGLPGGMPKFNFSDAELHEIVAFLHNAAVNSNSEEAERRKISLEDLLSGNAAAGKEFFYGKGHCDQCHSPTGDLAGIARRYDPMKLKTLMLYPARSKATAAVTLRSGQKVEGKLVHIDEFVVSIQDKAGWQHSWPRSSVTVRVNDPAEAHAKLLPQYTDADVHNLFAYIEKLQ